MPPPELVHWPDSTTSPSNSANITPISTLASRQGNSFSNSRQQPADGNASRAVLVASDARPRNRVSPKLPPNHVAASGRCSTCPLGSPRSVNLVPSQLLTRSQDSIRGASVEV